jgi:hypothetical protein
MPSNPYLKSDASAQQLDSFVLYLDVLGSREWVRGLTDENLEEVRQLLAGRRWFLHDDQHDYERQRLVSFTDNLVLGVPLDRSFDDGGLAFVISSCVYYQLNLAARGSFLRGGLTVGKHFMDEHLVVGQALVDAVDLEHLAVFPRVLVSEEVLGIARRESLHSHDDPWSYYLLQDEDDLVFVNYLPGVADDGIPGWDVDGLMAHRASIVGPLLTESLDERVRDKYVWAAQYHNFVCRRAVEQPRTFQATSDFDLRDLEIHEGLPAARLTRDFRPVPGL